MPSSPISPESEASKYLLARGIDLDFAADHGAVWTEDEDEIRERLGLEPVDDDDSGWTGEKGLNAAENKRESRRTSRAQNKFFDKELLSFPLYNGNGYLSKLFPVADGDKSKGFRVTLHCREPIFIPEKTWEARRDSSIPLFVTEGPSGLWPLSRQEG
jgi:hypothetical protein